MDNTLYVLMGHDDTFDRVLGIYATVEAARAALAAFDNTPDRFSYRRKFSVGYSIYAVEMGAAATDDSREAVWSDCY